MAVQRQWGSGGNASRAGLARPGFAGTRWVWLAGRERAGIGAGGTELVVAGSSGLGGVSVRSRRTARARTLWPRPITTVISRMPPAGEVMITRLSLGWLGLGWLALVWPELGWLAADRTGA